MANNTFTKTYVDGAALTAAMLDTAVQTLQLDISNTAIATTGSTSGQGLLSNGSGIAASFQSIPDPQGPSALRNYGLKATVASGVMVVTLTTKAGSVPTGTDKVDFNYSTNGTTSASYTSIQVSGSTTISLNASASLGYTPTSTTRVYVYAYYNTAAAAVKLALSARSDFDFGGSVITTAVTAAADSHSILYSTAAVTVVPRLMGYVDVAHNSTGSWQTPSKVNITQNETSNSGYYIATSSGYVSTTSTSFVAITNQSLTVIAKGGPVEITAIGADPTTTSGNSSVWALAVNSTDFTHAGFIQISRGGTAITMYEMKTGNTSAVNALTLKLPPGVIRFVDFPPPGSHTYSLEYKAKSGDRIDAFYIRMLVKV